MVSFQKLCAISMLIRLKSGCIIKHKSRFNSSRVKILTYLHLSLISELFSEV